MVNLAWAEANEIGHHYLGVEHLLLGLLREENGVAAQVLGSLGVTVDRVRARVVEIVAPPQDARLAAQSRRVPITPRAKRVLELALRESLSHGSPSIGTEHILLGLVRENDGIAARVLLEFDADPVTIRDKIPVPKPIPGIVVAGSRGRVVADPRIRVGHSLEVRGLLRAAAARALDDGRTDIEIDDLLLAMAREPTAARVIAELGVDETAIAAAIKRLGGTAEPPPESATGDQ